jgi:hypothetical protein
MQSPNRADFSRGHILVVELDLLAFTLFVVLQSRREERLGATKTKPTLTGFFKGESYV